ncbi:GFA family protein [Roseateles sp.]|uniref:GFA family protein n=1 Tax=Roseateles sp. TaxID=1971397 RepID=UPI003BA4541D
MSTELVGACFCGAVTLRAAAPPKGVIHCHCGQCRRLSGAAFTTWVSVARERCTVSGAESLAVFSPTPNGRRHFCKHCGSHVFTEDLRMPQIYGVPAGILQGEALSIAPSQHYFVSHKAAWHEIADALPQFGGESGYERLQNLGAEPPASAHRERFLAYLRHYAAKDLQAIADMLAADVVLRDWKICVHGREAAVAETRANFAAARSLLIEPLQLYESPQSVAGELRILVDDEVELFVVDVLDFDAEGKIKAIRAFLGRGPD